MFSIYSRGHPERIERLLRAWKLTEATSPVYLRLDEDDPYLKFYLMGSLFSKPENWTVVIGEETSDWQVYDEMRWDNKDLNWAGILSDCLVPHTMCWDIQMISAAMANGEYIVGDIVPNRVWETLIAEVRPLGVSLGPYSTLLEHIIFEVRE